MTVQASKQGADKARRESLSLSFRCVLLVVGRGATRLTSCLVQDRCALQAAMVGRMPFRQNVAARAAKKGLSRLCSQFGN